MDEPRIDVRLEPRGEAGTVAYVTLANPARLNTFTRALLGEFEGAIRGLGAREDLRVVVLRGEGKRAFIGGADIHELATLDTATAGPFIEALHRCCAALRDLPVPVIARQQGYTLGGGLEIALSCDLRIAAEDARFGMPEVCIGIPSVVEAALLPALVGSGRARRMLLLGETIDAAEALAWGLVERVVPAAMLDAAVEEWVAKLLANGRTALAAQKKLMRAWEGLPTEEAIAAGVPAFAEAYATDEPARMMRAFLERPRKPAAG